MASKNKQLAQTGSLVHTTGAETLAGVKTFSNSPVLPTPTLDTDGVNKSYVDNNAGGLKGGGTDKVFFENAKVMTTSYTITRGKNAMVAGPLTINDGVTLTIPDGSTLTIV